MSAIEELPKIELSDNVVTIRPIRADDAEAHLRGEDDETVRWRGEGKKSTPLTVSRWIEKMQENWKQDGPVFTFGISENNSCELIGHIDANTDNKDLDGVDENETNISYDVYPAGRGKGYATRAVNLICDFLKTRSIKAAVIRVHPDNVRSAKVAERCGFTKVSQIVIREGGSLAIYKKDL